MKVEYGTVQDMESWMELVHRVSWNFPGVETEEAIEDHRKTVLRFMGENRALCVKYDKKVVGVLLLSKKTQYDLLSGRCTRIPEKRNSKCTSGKGTLRARPIQRHYCNHIPG